MADAVGGKASTTPPKNLVGSFHARRGALWLPALRTQSDRELRSGLAEVVKCALIAGDQELRLLEERADALGVRTERSATLSGWRRR